VTQVIFEVTRRKGEVETAPPKKRRFTALVVTSKPDPRPPVVHFADQRSRGGFVRNERPIPWAQGAQGQSGDFKLASNRACGLLTMENKEMRGRGIVKMRM
jgi:hypothetical protein